MRLFKSLQFKISASLFLVGVVMIGINAARTYGRTVQFRRDSMKALAFSEGSRLSGMAQHLLRRKTSRAADLAIGYVSATPELENGMICDGDDIVRHASQQQYRGLTIHETPLAKYLPEIQLARSSMEGRVREFKESYKLVAFFPFWEGLARGEKGCVVLEYDLRIPLINAYGVSFHSSISQALALGGSCLALWLVLRSLVTLRVNGIVRQVQGMSFDTDPPPTIGGADELQEVSETIYGTHIRLKQSEQRFRQIASTMRDIFWMAPLDKREPPYVNGAYEPVMQRLPSALESNRWDWLWAVQKEDRRRCLALLKNLRKPGAHEEIEVRIVNADGEIRWLRCRGFAMASNTDSRCSVAGIGIDITDQKNMQRRLLDAAETERRRIGVDLHDDLCQRLVAARFNIGVLASAVGPDGSARLTSLVSELSTHLAEATGIARGFARGLAPVGIEVLGLPAAFTDLGSFIERAFHVVCRIECSNLDETISGEAATHIFRIAQELVSNAAKHSKPNWIELSFEVTDGEGRLLITHDGTPFRPSATFRAPAGMGLQFLQQRLDALGASLSYHTGTDEPIVNSVICIIPRLITN